MKLQLAPDLHVLVIDDMPIRKDALHRKGIITGPSFIATSATDGIKALEGLAPDFKWDVIFLDHDLETYVQDPYPREITGQHVARAIVELGLKPSLVVIHSMNPKGAEAIEGILKEAGINTLRVPIQQLLEA